MKVTHFSLYNKSGMNNVAASLVEAEKKLGLDSMLFNIQESKNWADTYDSDIFVSHTHFPDEVRKKITKKLRLVWVGHGTPEHVFQSAVEAGTNKGYGHGDSWMLCQHWLQVADARVTFWPRHQAIWQSLCDKQTIVHCIPMGVDKEFWKPTQSRGKFSGKPSLFTCENQHYFKWCLDLFIAWPWVYPRINGNPCLHAIYVPRDQHRWVFPLVNRNGASYASHISPMTFEPVDLRNAYCSTDFQIGLVRYGDYNRISLEANACGSKTISYCGNPYSDFHIHEGDQRVIADELVAILNGEVKPREKAVVPDISETAKGMKEIYEGIL